MPEVNDPGLKAGNRRLREDVAVLKTARSSWGAWPPPSVKSVATAIRTSQAAASRRPASGTCWLVSAWFTARPSWDAAATRPHSHAPWATSMAKQMSDANTA